MKAMILAAGRGERMKPLTDTCPKPLLKVNNIPLIEHHIINLAKAGVSEIMINLAWLGEQIQQYLGDGSRWQVNISYSWERQEALETAGGIVQTLDFFDEDEPFWLISGDIYAEIDFTQKPSLNDTTMAHLFMVANPSFNRTGDFCLTQQGFLSADGTDKLTYASYGIFKKQFFNGVAQGKRKLAPLLKSAMLNQQVTGSLHQGHWHNLGTPEQLASLNQTLIERAS